MDARFLESPCTLKICAYYNTYPKNIVGKNNTDMQFNNKKEKESNSVKKFLNDLM